MFTRELKAYVVCNFNCRIEAQGFLKVTGSHVLYRKNGNVSEMVQDRDVITTNH